MLTQIRSGQFVAGRFRTGGGDDLRVEDPSNGAALRVLDTAAEADVDAALDSAWTSTARVPAPVERAQLLHQVALELRRCRRALAHLVAIDGGLPLSLAGRDVDAAARYFEFYAAAAQTERGESIPLGTGVLDLTEREPYGVCLVLLPFNFPLQLAARDLAPALATGNAVVLKASDQAPLAPLALAALCARAGAPPGLVNVLTGTGAVGAALVRDPRVNHVTFTGSHNVGRGVMRACAERVTPLTLELGGKSPHVVFADADLDAAVSAVVGTTMRTAGQACSAGTRVLVEAPAHDAFVTRLVSAVKDLSVGPALDDRDVGPVISRRQRDAVAMGVAQAVADGARVLAGTVEPLPEPGWFVCPTVLVDVSADSAYECEELFGPVVGVASFDDETAAVARANGTPYGLVAGVWTRDVDRALRVSRALRAGQVFVNTYGVGSGVELPFGGGVGQSGFGRVKGLAALQEYSTVKNIQLAYRPVPTAGSDT